jgi:hypothetical protein
MPVKDLEGLLPAFGVILPAGASLQSGTMNTNMALDEALDRLVTTTWWRHCAVRRCDGSDDR